MKYQKQKIIGNLFLLYMSK